MLVSQIIGVKSPKRPVNRVRQDNLRAIVRIWNSLPLINEKNAEDWKIKLGRLEEKLKLIFKNGSTELLRPKFKQRFGQTPGQLHSGVGSHELKLLNLAELVVYLTGINKRYLSFRLSISKFNLLISSIPNNQRRAFLCSALTFALTKPSFFDTVPSLVRSLIELGYKVQITKEQDSIKVTDSTIYISFKLAHNHTCKSSRLLPSAIEHHQKYKQVISDLVSLEGVSAEHEADRLLHEDRFWIKCAKNSEYSDEDIQREKSKHLGSLDQFDVPKWANALCDVIKTEEDPSVSELLIAETLLKMSLRPRIVRVKRKRKRSSAEIKPKKEYSSTEMKRQRISKENVQPNGRSLRLQDTGVTMLLTEESFFKS